MIRSHYIARRPDKAPFGEHWCGPETFIKGVYMPIARYPAEPGADGQDVTVHCRATPARCYLIEAHASVLKSGQTLAGFSLCTGYGMARMAVVMAEAIAGGKLRLDCAPVVA